MATPACLYSTSMHAHCLFPQYRKKKTDVVFACSITRVANVAFQKRRVLFCYISTASYAHGASIALIVLVFTLHEFCTFSAPFQMDAYFCIGVCQVISEEHSK